MTETFLSMRGISKAFAGVPALKNAAFTCQRGTVHALVGENGAGKSTLMKILAGAVQADAGEIVFKGQARAHLTAGAAIALGISIIYQELALIPYMTVAENIFLGREPRSRWGVVKRRAMTREAESLLRRLDTPVAPDALVGDLTVARRQMVEIAKALSKRADLIIMDEPSAILAGHELDALFGVIDALVKDGVTVIYISHRLDEVFRVAHAVTVLKDGEVVGTQPIRDLTRPKLIEMMVGRALEEIYPPRQTPPGAVVLSVEDVSSHAVHHASLTLRKGEILGIAGMIGAGRTELARAIYGADKRTGGRVILNGVALRGGSPAEAMRAGLAFAPEDRKAQGLFTSLSIRHNLTLPILDKLSPGGVIQRGRELETISAAKSAFDIHMASPEQEARTLSGGNQQKIVLAKGLETQPAVVILDEPTRGVDVGAKFEIYQIMRRLAESGVGIVMISSELPEILGMSDRILVMRDGRIAGELSRDEASEEKIIGYATS
jgi:ribose transport system ATP-binding protein